MLKKTVAVVSVAALAAGVIAMPAAAASLDNPVQIAGCSACKAKCGAKCGACGGCKAKCGACAGKCQAKCGACAGKCKAKCKAD